MTDSYLSETGILKNKLGIEDANMLQRAEADYTKLRLYELELLETPTGNFDIYHLKALHQHLFQDVYEWAGRTRADEIEIDGIRFASLPLFSKGDTTFMVSPQVNQHLERVLKAIAGQGLKGLSRLKFTQQAADLLSAINAIHPFREGNGRTQRAFINELAKDAGYLLDWGVVSQERMVAVSIASFNGDLPAMRRLLEEIVDPVKVAALRNALHYLEQQSINWNERYVAIATPGVSYSGVVVATAKQHVILFSSDHQVIVAKVRDIPRDGKTEEVRFTSS